MNNKQKEKEEIEGEDIYTMAFAWSLWQPCLIVIEKQQDGKSANEIQIIINIYDMKTLLFQHYDFMLFFDNINYNINHN